ncbi:Acetyltransferase (GNAT) domain-containing protein [Mucilaginibacter gossypiicola]|uniref:Acetyltransferase (GNAT) domain-containing protein n=1 Tax=Mucilaginibacter gossypiicola TaxID=551995 RepID=A0A1H8G8Q6_9SPHI|nr:GNAT family N-acetyltransferase [Mucilaginibacter gossypiicola]SEN40511.1 Acetyltransferase (GNAT) domain-containing protein [Mucilaginibacter gossypiicola]
MYNDGYRIERLTGERLADMTSLHKAVYGKTVPSDFFARKYNTAFTGAMYTGYLAYAGDVPAAFYGVIPCFIDYDGQPVLAAQSADTMTHPHHRGKGLFIKLAELTYELCYHEKILIAFGFPNQNSLPGFVNKLNWQVSAQMECFIIPVRALPLEKLANKFPVLKGLYRFYAKNVIKKHASHQKGFTSSLIGEGFSGLHRDSSYLGHKTYTESFTIKAGNSSVWFRIADGMVVGDIDIEADDLPDIIPKLKKIARQLGLRKLQFQADKRSALNAFLKRYANPIPSFPVIVKDLGARMPLDKIAFAFADIDIF